jgi:uncharacterized Zn-binding protein involved in type VI secretion
MPALRIGDMDFGMPHGHAHPPNLTPFGMIFLPSTGPVIPIPILSGAQRTLINGMPAARCGDIGLSIWCGSYVPLYEILLGSSSVWIEGARAARMTIDITSHCIFTVRPRAGDPPIGSFLGTTYTGSPNVVIGGVPMPSLLSMAIGKLFKLAFVGAAKIAGKLRAAKEVAESTADEAADFADEITEVRPPDTLPPGTLAATDAIDNVLSQFSDAVRNLARLSPTLKRQLEGLERAMWAIIRGSDGKSFCDPRGFIRVGQNADPGRELTMIAHESGHAYNTLMPEVPPNGLTRDQYAHANVGRHMLDEGAAQFNAAKVRDELAQAGHDVPMPGGQAQQYSDIYDRYKAGQSTEEEAVNEMADLMRNEVNSVDNRPYPEYYGDEYQRRYDDYEAANPPAASSTPDPGATNPDLTDPAFATDPGTTGSGSTSEFDAADTNPGTSGSDFESAATNPRTGTLPGW